MMIVGSNEYLDERYIIAFQVEVLNNCSAAIILVLIKYICLNYTKDDRAVYSFIAKYISLYHI
jgi:hypothetical protein